MAINLPWGHVRSHTKFRLIGSAVLTFIGYKQTDKLNLNIDYLPVYLQSELFRFFSESSTKVAPLPRNCPYLWMSYYKFNFTDPPSFVPVGGELLVKVGGEIFLRLTEKVLLQGEGSRSVLISLK